MAKAGIMASVQPVFLAFYGREGMENFELLLGKSRIKYVHPYRTILDSGIPIRGGSKSPATRYVPLDGIQAAVTHPNKDESATLEKAVGMFTATAVWSAFEDNEKGTIETRTLADLVVFEDDPFAVHYEKFAVSSSIRCLSADSRSSQKPNGTIWKLRGCC